MTATTLIPPIVQVMQSNSARRFLPEDLRLRIVELHEKLSAKDQTAVDSCIPSGEFRILGAFTEALGGKYATTNELGCGIVVASDVPNNGREQLARDVEAAFKNAVKACHKIVAEKAAKAERIQKESAAFQARLDREAEEALREDWKWRVERIEKHIGLSLDD